VSYETFIQYRAAIWAFAAGMIFMLVVQIVAAVGPGAAYHDVISWIWR
jgi:hypothetical protein